MKELIIKKSDGTVTYDIHKFFTIEDAILAEWKENSPTLDKNVLSKIMEKIYDKDLLCTDGKGRYKLERWNAYVEEKAKQLTSVKEKCYCEQLLEQFHKDGTERVHIGDDSYGPAITMTICVDPWTKKRLYFYLNAYEEGINSTGYIKYCPFCGKKLTEIVK